MNIIKSFSGKYKKFSNFYPVIIKFENLTFPSVEHAYQAAKSTNFTFRRKIAALPKDKAGVARIEGNNILCRREWEDIKSEIMFQLLCQKFNIHEFKNLLISTGDSIIIEGNRWHDNFWGDCSCQKCINILGQNYLGKMIMELRRRINESGYCYGRYT